MKRIPNRRKPSEFTHPMNISNPRLPCKRCISTNRLPMHRPLSHQEALGQSFEPAFAVGAAYRATGRITLMADARRDTGDALVTSEKSHLGVGLEFRPLRMLPLRGGISRVSGGRTQFSAGLGG